MFCGVGDESLERRGEDARPDEALSDRAFGGVEAMEIRVRLPLLEEQLNLPAKAIQCTHIIDAEGSSLEVCVQVRERLFVPLAALVDGNQSALIE